MIKKSYLKILSLILIVYCLVISPIKVKTQNTNDILTKEQNLLISFDLKQWLSQYKKIYIVWPEGDDSYIEKSNFYHQNKLSSFLTTETEIFLVHWGVNKTGTSKYYIFQAKSRHQEYLFLFQHDKYKLTLEINKKPL